MKKISFIIIAIAIIGFGCKKQNTTPQTEIGDPTAAKIEQFLNAVESNNKSGTDLTITDAIWNVEAALNYAYCDMSIPPVKIDYDTINFEIPVTSNMINWNNVVNLYSYCQQEMNTYVSTFDSPVFFRLVDLEEKGISNGSLVVKFSVVIGEKEARTIPPVGYFTNSWMYGMDLGTCNSGSPSGTGDLAQEIKWRINYYELTYIVGTYFTDVIDKNDLYATDYLNPNDNVPYDNYYDYMMLVADGNAPNYHLCYSPAECDFYLDGTNWVIHTDVNNGGHCPVGKTPMNIKNLEATVIPGGKSNTTWLHWGEVRYGIMHHQRR